MYVWPILMDLPIVMCVDIAVTSSYYIEAFTKLGFHADADAAQRKYAGTLLNFILFVAAKSFYVCAVRRTVKPA